MANLRLCSVSAADTESSSSSTLLCSSRWYRTGQQDRDGGDGSDDSGGGGDRYQTHDEGGVEPVDNNNNSNDSIAGRQRGAEPSYTQRRPASETAETRKQSLSQEDQGDDAVKETDLASLPRYAQDTRVMQLVQEAAPLSAADDIINMLKSAKNAAEVRHVLERLAYRHPMCFDVLNGHGFRVAVLQALTASAPHTYCMDEWFDCVDRFRRLGFVLTRTFAAEGYTTIRQWLSQTFNHEGRTPRLVTEGIAHIRELTHWCQEDGLVFDHVLYTRIVFLMTMIVSFFDRQNRYRATFPADFAKRDGIVVEWVIGTERCCDFDECILQCDAFMEEVLELLRKDIPSRPNFSLIYRLIDYYFATDNIEKMIATMEDAVSYGVNIAESSTAKLMQLACALNHPNVPELFIRWRVALPQCVLATPDMSRLLFYYGRAGGGRPCPLCGESFNHRNVNVYHWLQTPPHQRNCPALSLARVRKGDLEEARALPQNADWSERAFDLWELSRARAIEWGPVEWRAFLLCCMFADTSTALRAKELLDTNLDPGRMDDFLRATYMRLLRHHAPREAWPTVRTWQSRQYKMSPIALQEGLMAAAATPEAAERLDGLAAMWQAVRAKDSYVMPFTKRYFERRLRELQESRGISREEVELFEEIIAMRPRHVSLLDMKDSASDFVMGTTMKNVYIPPAVLERVAARRAARSSQQQLHVDA